MAITLPKFDALTAIVDPNTGKPTVQMQKFMEQFATAIVQNEQQLADAQAMAAQAQGQAAAAAAVANNASNTSSQANSTSNPASSQHQSSTASPHVSSSSWTPVTNLTFYNSVVASSVTLGSTGPTSARSDYNPKVTTVSDGSIRVVRVVGGVDTILTTQPFSTDSDGNLAYTPISYSTGDSLTGTITYRLDVQKVSGADFSASFILDVTRNP